MARIVDQDTARRIAVRAQLLDGSASGVLDTVRSLGSLQLDPVATVAPAQILVLWSRLEAFDVGELDRLLWEERSLFEWDAYLYPIESLPIVRAWMRAFRRPDDSARGRWYREFLARNRRFRTYVLGELERRGPLLSRELEDRSAEAAGRHRWYGARYVGRMLQLLDKRGEIAVVGRRGGARLWDLAERWYPPEEGRRLTREQADRRFAEQRFRSLGVRQVRGEWHAHPEVPDGPVPERLTVLSPFDRLIQDRDRAEALFGFRYRLEMFVPAAKREYGYYVLPVLRGDRVVGRAEPRFDRRTGGLELLGTWGDTEGLETVLDELAGFLRGAYPPRSRTTSPRTPRME
jgi:uncharacterized protein YcaQ